MTHSLKMADVAISRVVIPSVAISRAKANPQTAPNSNCAQDDAKPSQAKLDTTQHTAILEMGVSIWNQWRASDPLTVPNLQNADLSGLYLENANLARANLRGVCLDGACLYDADFQSADLCGASLKRSALVGANFCKANLSDASLEKAYLAQSDLSYANLTGACLQEADLRAALMTKAVLANTRLAAAEMAESFGLPLLQLKSATDVHSAHLQDEFQRSLTLASVSTKQTLNQASVSDASDGNQQNKKRLNTQAASQVTAQGALATSPLATAESVIATATINPLAKKTLVPHRLAV